MNPIKTLIEQQRGATDSAALFKEMMLDTGESLRDVEATVGALHFAFKSLVKEHAQSAGQEVCSFCHRNQSEVKTLVAATAAAICDQCIEIARATVLEKRPGKRFSWLR